MFDVAISTRDISRNRAFWNLGSIKNVAYSFDDMGPTRRERVGDQLDFPGNVITYSDDDGTQKYLNVPSHVEQKGRREVLVIDLFQGTDGEIRQLAQTPQNRRMNPANEFGFIEKPNELVVASFFYTGERVPFPVVEGLAKYLGETIQGYEPDIQAPAYDGEQRPAPPTPTQRPRAPRRRLGNGDQ